MDPVKRPAPVIALTTDFGLVDPYAGILKGVLLGLCPEARVVDLTHGVPPQDVLAGCLALEAARPYFPPGTIHLCVVDPGVGTGRPAVAVRTRRDVFVGPDNGLFSFLRGDEILEVRSLESAAVRLQPVSRTFHGRDVFAPAAAHLGRGLPWADLGPSRPLLGPSLLPEAEVWAQRIRGVILGFDRFGNAVTSIRAERVPWTPRRVLVGGAVVPYASTYGDVPPDAPLCLAASSGRIEVGVRNGSARRRLGLARGTPIVLEAPEGEPGGP
ncbi:MAG: SAM-dependent chlorinase/fluorinase [Deferrisomatales bacterium]|nr:SAM-dependent chlorinase/fluorinase [Deferrisomatales bacterium]